MANVYAVKTGNWSDVTVWNTGALPTSADDVYSNNFVVTVNVSATVLSVRNTSGAGISGGGNFLLQSGITLQCTAASGAIQDGGYSNLLSSSISTGSCTVIATLVTGTLNNTSAATPVLYHNGAGTVNFVGNYTFSNGNNWQIAINNGGTGTINITAVGNLTNSPAGSVNPYAAIYNGSTGTINITGNLLGSGDRNYVASNESTGTLTVIGSLTMGNGRPCIASGSANQNTFLSGPFISNNTGVQPNLAYRWRWVNGVGSSYMTVPNYNGTGYKNLYTADNSSSASGQPAASNVRSGTVYGPANELTGTCAVPAAGSVALGVPVDATTGTAVLTIDAVKQGCSKAVVPALLALG